MKGKDIEITKNAEFNPIIIFSIHLKYIDMFAQNER